MVGPLPHCHGKRVVMKETTNAATQEDSEKDQYIADELLCWFKQSARKLPWRQGYNPYHVLLSEIMLQQTQMERGVTYFLHWIKRFPDFAAVAKASEQEILKYWEGLGYYARARNLHATARLVTENYQGILPMDPELLRSLPGIGPYTAAAVASIAGNVDIAVVDANVERVYARLFDIAHFVKKGIGKKIVAQRANQLLPRGKARFYNQAVMEFGALVCLPKNPHCSQCPLKRYCLARERGNVANRPILEKKKETIRIEMATGFLVHDGKVFIQQRKKDDVWGGLWEFPGGQLEQGENATEAIVREYQEETGFSVVIGEKIATVQHSYMHYRVILHGYFCQFSDPQKIPVPRLTAASQHRWVTTAGLKNFAFPAGHRKLIEILNTQRL